MFGPDKLTDGRSLFSILLAPNGAKKNRFHILVVGTYVKINLTHLKTNELLKICRLCRE